MSQCLRKIMVPGPVSRAAARPASTADLLSLGLLVAGVGRPIGRNTLNGKIGEGCIQ